MCVGDVSLHGIQIHNIPRILRQSCATMFPTMKALKYYGRRDMRLEDVPIPEPADDEARLRIAYASICQTDVERWWHGPTMARWKTEPKTVGHETAGCVEAIGRDVRGLSVGDRVMVNNIRPCTECFWCIRGLQSRCADAKTAGFALDGGLADYMTWPESHLIKLPYSIPDVQAPLIEPTSVAVHATRRSGVKAGDTVAVIGCGTVGMLTMQVLRAAGARVIAGDLRAQSLELALKLGADAAINTGDEDALEQLMDLTDGIGADIVVETAGAVVTPRIAINWTRPSGTTVLVGIHSGTAEFDFNEIVGTEKTVIGSVAAQPGDMEKGVHLIADGKVVLDDLVSEVIPLDRVIEDGFERMLKPEKDVFRIMVSPDA